MTKQDLIKLRDDLADANSDTIKKALRFAINRIEDLESDLREAKTLAKAIQRLGQITT